MKVFYEKKIGDQIIDAKCRADMKNRVINYILLSKSEAISLANEFPHLPCRSRPIPTWREVHNSQYYGIKLKLEGEEDETSN